MSLPFRGAAHGGSFTALRAARRVSSSFLLPESTARLDRHHCFTVSCVGPSAAYYYNEGVSKY